MEKVFDWITTVSSIVATLSIIIALISYLLSRKEFKHDHERARREKAIDLILSWSNSLDEQCSITRKFAELLNDEQLRCINNLESFYIQQNPERNIKLLAASLGKKVGELKIKNSQALIDEDDSARIKWQLIKYLNNLESIITAWVYKIVDESIIEDEFSYLFLGKDSGKALKKFRDINGGSNSYPSLDLFEKRMNEKLKKEIEQKKKLG